MKKEDTLIPEDHIKNIQGSWYKPTKIMHKGGYLTLSGTTTGCGLSQVYGISYLDSNDVEAIETLKKTAKQWGAGAILCTLGMPTYKHCEEHILKIGFQLLANYPNYHHHRMGSVDHTQNLYILYL